MMEESTSPSSNNNDMGPFATPVLRSKDRKTDVSSPVKRNRFLSSAAAQPAEDEDNNNAEMLEQTPDQQDDEVDENQQANVNAFPPALVVRKKRSEAISKVSVAMDAANVLCRPSAAANTGPRQRRWQQAIESEAACGIYVYSRQQQLESVARSTMVRLPERLAREQATSELSEPAKNDRYFERMLGGRDTLDLAEPVFLQCPIDCGSEPWPTDPRKAPEPATLEITIDSLLLDDHVSFTLHDRIFAQLRSLYTRYGRLQQQEPWFVHLERLDAFLESIGLQQALPIASATGRWKSQMLQEAEAVLSDFLELQQLHQQILSTWSEVQNAARHEHQPSRWELRTAKRAEPIDLLRLKALREVLILGDDSESPAEDQHEDQKATIEHLSKQLELLGRQDQCLGVVLWLRAIPLGGEGAGSIMLPPAPPGLTVFPSKAHRFYIVILVNGKHAFRSKTQTWTPSNSSVKDPVLVLGMAERGLVRFDESVRLRLPFFPQSVSIAIYSKRGPFALARDSALSSSTIPLLVPGEMAVATAAASSSRLQIPLLSVGPSDEWYQFSSVRPIPRAHWHKSFLQSPHLASAGVRHASGRLHVRASWLPLNPTPTSFNSSNALYNVRYLPPKRPSRGHLTSDERIVGSRAAVRGSRQQHQREERNQSGFSYEQDFLVHLVPLENVLDPNDPENARVQRLQKHRKLTMRSSASTREVFRTSALSAPAPGARAASWSGPRTLTKRNWLLRMRDREHVAIHGTSIAQVPPSIGAPTAADRRKTPWEHPVFEHQPVPLLEQEILSNEQYLSLLRPEMNAFEHRLKVQQAEQAGDLHSLERQRCMNLLKIQDFLNRVKQSQTATTEQQQRLQKENVRTTSKALASIIQEQPLPVFPGTLDFSGLANFFTRRRRLRPRVVQRSAPMNVAEWPTHCDLYVQIQRATNVPTRRLGTSERPTVKWLSPRSRSAKSPRGTNNDGEETEFREEPEEDFASESHVFVEISFQGKTRMTSCAVVSSSRSGNNPVWMETLVVPFRAPMDDWTPDAVRRCRDTIRLSLFDQVVTSTDDSSDPDSELKYGKSKTQVRSIHQENRYLGGLDIAFGTLYQANGAFEASLRCEMPVEHFGYTYSHEKKASGGEDDHGDEEDGDIDGVVHSRTHATLLSLMMTLDPLLPQPTPTRDPVGASLTSSSNGRGEIDQGLALRHYASNWTASMRRTNSTTKQRNFQVFVRNLHHDRTFLPQYLGPQEPPAALAQATTVQALVRFVKLIPFLDDWALFDAKSDVWCTSHEFLSLNAGDIEEHAVLLCNLFSWFDRDDPDRSNFLVIGHAVPEGDSVYVLRQNTGVHPPQRVLWNASTGAGYLVQDEDCPVRDISMIVASDNVFANIQPVRARLCDLDWSFRTSTTAWRPFFQPRHSRESFGLVPCVQHRILECSETPREYVELVEREVRDALKVQIRRWRSSKSTTIFHLDAGRRLRSRLELWETRLQGAGRSKNRETKGKRNTEEQEDEEEAKHIVPGKDLCGLPLNVTFTDVDTIVALVKNTVRVALLCCRSCMMLMGVNMLEYPRERAIGRGVCAGRVRVRLPQLRGVALGLLGGPHAGVKLLMND